MEDEIEIKEAGSGGVNPDDPSTWPDIDGPAEAVVGSERILNQDEIDSLLGFDIDVIRCFL